MGKLYFENLSAFQSMLGKPLPHSRWVTVTQDMIHNFAKATLDVQWVHVDVERARKESPFKSTIAHGFMSLSLLSRMLMDVFSIKSERMSLNYGLNKVRFPHPVPVNSRLQLQSVIKSIEYQHGGAKITFSCTVVIEGIEKPACVAEFLAMIFE